MLGPVLELMFAPAKGNTVTGRAQHEPGRDATNSALLERIDPRFADGAFVSSRPRRGSSKTAFKIKVALVASFGASSVEAIAKRLIEGLATLFEVKPERISRKRGVILAAPFLSYKLPPFGIRRIDQLGARAGCLVCRLHRCPTAKLLHLFAIKDGPVGIFCRTNSSTRQQNGCCRGALLGCFASERLEFDSVGPPVAKVVDVLQIKLPAR